MQITLPPAGKLPAIKAALTLLPEKHRHLPPELAEFEKLLDTLRDLPEPLTDTEIARSLADAEPNELPALLDTLATEKARGEALRAANGNGLRTLLERRRSSAVLAALPDVLERLAPVFTQATDTLAKAGAELPEGAAALDPRPCSTATPGRPTTRRARPSTPSSASVPSSPSTSARTAPPAAAANASPSSTCPSAVPTSPMASPPATSTTPTSSSYSRPLAAWSTTTTPTPDSPCSR
ncbi:hypothetical protein ACFSVJ_08130 [Prauserella oleivorans]